MRKFILFENFSHSPKSIIEKIYPNKIDKSQCGIGAGDFGICWLLINIVWLNPNAFSYAFSKTTSSYEFQLPPNPPGIPNISFSPGGH